MATPEIPNLNPPWQSMTVDRYAALEQLTGMNVVKVGDIWWHQVRPFLYRPLLPYKKYDSGKTMAGLNRVGAFQFGVEDGQPHNSYLNPIMFEELDKYEIKALPYSAQKHIKKALKNGVTVSRIVDEKEFAEIAYPCYMCFYQRTKYSYDKRRTQKDGFARWAHTLFQFPETVILGAFAGRELVSYEISCVVEDTLCLKTLVNSDRALKLGAADLLLHTYRSGSREQPAIRQIYDSMLGQNPGINDYYFVRGARVLSLPAALRMHPAVLWLIKGANKGIYRRLLGLRHDQLPAI
ncbi:MAG: hypothetical protein WBV31_21010 [Terriglobales bacterium]|jgi:hypothetical protein